MRKVTIGLSLLWALFSLMSCSSEGNLLDQITAKADHGQSGQPVNPSTLPGSIQTYVSDNYPEASIIEAYLDDECGVRFYEVELSTGLELAFDLQGNFLGTYAAYEASLGCTDDDDDDYYDDDDDCDDDDHYVHPDSLPSGVHTYLSANYPNAAIDEAELETECGVTFYEVELTTGEELAFDLQGNYLGFAEAYEDSLGCDDDDDDD